jgi:glyoxylase-like metal-dependent hydrolase (beta-lactamase superfamily II)
MSAQAIPTYDVFAIRYATRDAKRADNFIGGDPHDAPMPLDYYVWAIVGKTRSFVVDTGFNAEVAARRKRDFLRCPAEALKLVGLDPATVQDVILTHLHYDHVGGFNRFPKAKFHLQEPEIHYATGRYMQYHRLAHSFEVEDIVGVVRLNFAHRVQFHNGGTELTPGITLHPVGGHSVGLQFVKVHTKRGWVVVASDTTHYYENMMTGRPFTTAFHIGLMLEAYDTLRREAPTPQHIVPGHDPKVMQFYPPPTPELAGIVVRLDVTPDDAELAQITERR